MLIESLTTWSTYSEVQIQEAGFAQLLEEEFAPQSTRWSIWLRNTVCWHQMKSSATVWPSYSKAQLFFNVNKSLLSTRWTTLCILFSWDLPVVQSIARTRNPFPDIICGLRTAVAGGVVLSLMRGKRGAKFLALKQESRILGHSSDPACGFSMMDHVRLCAVWHMENWLDSSLNHIQGWITVRESYSRALEQRSLEGEGRPILLRPCDHPQRRKSLLFSPHVTTTSS